ncbi:hypothetical protein TKK_0007187 [Trichogramma kaykai]
MNQSCTKLPVRTVNKNREVANDRAQVVAQPQQRQLQQQQQQDEMPEQVDECVAIMETTTITDYSKTPVNTGTRFSRMLAWPIKLLQQLGCRVTLELGRLLDDKVSNANSEDPIKYLKNIASFVICLVIVKHYSDYIDNMIETFIIASYEEITHLFRLLNNLECKDFDTIGAFCIVVLFWIGAYRIVRNIIVKIAEAPKLCS